MHDATAQVEQAVRAAFAAGWPTMCVSGHERLHRVQFGIHALARQA